MFSRRSSLDFGFGLRAALALSMLSSVSATVACFWPSPANVVQRVLQKYTGPAVAVGASIREVRSSLGVPFEFVPHLGYVAHVGDSTGVSELRLLLPRGARARIPDDDDRADAVEILTTSRNAFSELAIEVSSFFRDPPSEGCLMTTQPGNYREVRYWTAPRRNGGIALTNDYGGNRAVAHRGMVVVGLLAFTGPFEGGETMRGNYSPQPCAVVTGIVR